MSDTAKLGPPEIPEVAYLCDRKACEVCNDDICRHTLDISHAKNFECFNDFGIKKYIEKED